MVFDLWSAGSFCSLDRLHPCWLCGLLNGVLVSRIKLPPFIVTLGTWYIIMALCLIYSANETLREADVTAATNWLHFFGRTGRPFAVDLGHQLELSFGKATHARLRAADRSLHPIWYALNYTAWAAMFTQLATTPTPAQLSGIRVDRVLLSV